MKEGSGEKEKVRELDEKEGERDQSEKKENERIRWKRWESDWVKKGESERAMRWKKGEWIHEMEREWIRENGESERLDKNEERWD